MKYSVCALFAFILLQSWSPTALSGNPVTAIRLITKLVDTGSDSRSLKNVKGQGPSPRNLNYPEGFREDMFHGHFSYSGQNIERLRLKPHGPAIRAERFGELKYFIDPHREWRQYNYWLSKARYDSEIRERSSYPVEVQDDGFLEYLIDRLDWVIMYNGNVSSLSEAEIAMTYYSLYKDVPGGIVYVRAYAAFESLDDYVTSVAYKHHGRNDDRKSLQSRIMIKLRSGTFDRRKGSFESYVNKVAKSQVVEMQKEGKTIRQLKESGSNNDKLQDDLPGDGRYISAVALRNEVEGNVHAQWPSEASSTSLDNSLVLVDCIEKQIPIFSKYNSIISAILEMKDSVDIARENRVTESHISKVKDRFKQHLMKECL